MTSISIGYVSCAGKHVNILGLYWVYMGIMEKKMETTKGLGFTLG